MLLPNPGSYCNYVRSTFREGRSNFTDITLHAEPFFTCSPTAVHTWAIKSLHKKNLRGTAVATYPEALHTLAEFTDTEHFSARSLNNTKRLIINNKPWTCAFVGALTMETLTLCMSGITLMLESLGKWIFICRACLVMLFHIVSSLLEIIKDRNENQSHICFSWNEASWHFTALLWLSSAFMKHALTFKA